MPVRDRFGGFRHYISAMKTRITLGFLMLSALPALAQAPQILPDASTQQSQNQAIVNQQIQQTQLNNEQVQQSVQRNQLHQQRQFNAMPAPAFQQPHVVVKPAPAPKPPTTTP